MNVRLVVAGAGLFLSGAGVGAFVANRYLEKKWMHAAEVEIHDSMKEFYEKQNQMAENSKDGLNPGMTVIVNASDDAKDFVNDIIRKQGYIENEIKKSEIDIFKAKDSSDEDWECLVEAERKEEENEEEFPDEYIQLEAKESKEPYVISFESFQDEFDTHDKITLCYFAGDDTLTGEDEELDPLLYDMVGEDALTSFGEMSEDPDIVYVRNENFGVDYEIIRMNKSYQEAVLGLHAEPVPVPKRPAKRSRPKTEDI